MKAMFDINVVLDIVARREGFYDDAKNSYLKVIKLGGTAMLPVHALTTIYYLLGAAATRRQRTAAMNWILSAFEIGSETAAQVAAAWHSDFTDFEDAMVAACAQAGGCDFILTRNSRDFAASDVRVLTPTEFLAS